MTPRYFITMGVITAIFGLTAIFLTSPSDWNLWAAGATSGFLFGMGISAVAKAKEADHD
ncbi:hypothetical protein GA0061101_106158 [Rhizobium lusitanum]|uniref:Uncharacterized protein n=1 Tax=Rhizobium lusitanum TaxID=293958 RepID=A0A1C3VSL6_9HYPH|nr:hypothetical protein GA0061101_106158 [Rhizobium lusitanum]